ncbi:MAG: UPF0016 family protein [Planctomycetota bacterium]|nr:MAG: UPF0016 family protein [Planctomycetota bacterium]
MWSTFLTVFATVFVAELGDKTQLATLLYAADGKHSRTAVFLGASAALVASVLVAVLVGGWIARHVEARTLSYVAGAGFILIGVWTIVRA